MRSFVSHATNVGNAFSSVTFEVLSSELNSIQFHINGTSVFNETPQHTHGSEQGVHTQSTNFFLTGHLQKPKLLGSCHPEHLVS